MRLRGAGIAFFMGLSLAACQPGAAAPGATQPSDDEPTDASVQGEPVGLDGTLTITSGGSNGGGGSSSESHYSMVVTVHLVAQDGGGPTFVDAGSTFTYTGSTRSDDEQTLSSCGLHTESTGSGGGTFVSPGLIVASYGYNNPVVSIGINAPYTSDGSRTFLCNGDTLAGPSELVESPNCGDPSGGSVIGTILPGGVMVKAAGQIIDFACSEEFAIGSGGTVVTGTLASR